MKEENTFTGSLKAFFKRYFDFIGVSSRSQFWYAVLWLIIFNSVLGFITGLIRTNSYTVDEYTNQVIILNLTRYYGALVISIIWELIIFIPWLAIIVRRLRDAGHHWTCLFLLLIPLVGLIIIIVYLTKPSIYQ